MEENEFQWGVFIRINIIPLNDTEQHIESEDCWCQPKLQQEDKALLIIHDAADGRIIAEKFIEELKTSLS